MRGAKYFLLSGVGRLVLGLLLLAALLVPERALAQTTVTYVLQDSNFPTQFNSGGDFFNQGATELGMWANNGAKQTAAWRNFTIDGSPGAAARNLQVGDVFTITVAATRAFGQIGFSLNAGGSQGGSYANNISGSRMFINTDNFGAWYVGGLSGGASANTSLSYVPLENTYKDYRFTIRITSQTTADIFLTVDGTDYRAYNRTLGGSAGANISAFSIYGSDMWDGSSNDNAFWKQTTSVQSTGRVEVGYFATGGQTITPGLISDGLAADSTTTASPNAVFVGGSAGSQVNFNQANTYTGATTVNQNARLEVQNASALGGTANGTTVSDGGALSIFNAGGITIAGESLTLNGVGVSGANGALRNTGGNNAWNGAISLGSNTRINADTTGTSGSLTIGGNVAAGANVLFFGAMGGTNNNTGGNITVNGVISGAGASQNDTTTSIYKDGIGVLTLGGANTYTGDTRIAQGNLTVSGSGSLGSGSDVFIAGGGSLTVNTSTTVASVREWGNTNSGTISIGSGATLTVNGADRGNMFQNSISGAGGLTMAGSGNSTLGLFGTQSYTGATTVSGGKLSTGVALASSAVTISAGTFETTAANILSDTATVTMSGGTYALGGSDTVGGLSGNGGTLNLGSHTLTANVAANNTFGGSIIGTGGFTKGGVGRLSLSGSSSYSGATAVNAGELQMAGGSIANSAVTVASGASLTGYGRVGALGGAGSIGPGNSPGIITATQIIPTGGLDFNFEFTGTAPVFNNAANSVNDLIRITGNTPFSQSLSASNIINIYFSGAALFTGSTAVQYKGGFFTDTPSNFFNSISGATVNYFFQMSGGSASYNGVSYGTKSEYEAFLSDSLTITISTIGQSGNFDGPTNIDGQILQLEVIPEPSTYALLALAAGTFAYLRLRRRNN